MGIHTSQTDIILSYKTDIDKLYNLLFRLFISYTSVYKQEKKTENTAQIHTNFKKPSREIREIFQKNADADIAVANLCYFKIDIAPYRMVRSDRKF